MTEHRSNGRGDAVPALPYRARDIRHLPDLVLCLLDPDEYLVDPQYKAHRAAGGRALRNLWAFDVSGRKLWEAEMPDSVDYYYEIASLEPLTVRSFSGHTCQLRMSDGAIVSKVFLK